jgi:hypothetical protein
MRRGLYGFGGRTLRPLTVGNPPAELPEEPPGEGEGAGEEPEGTDIDDEVTDDE